MDVKDAMEKVLALDKTYPLPLLGIMLDRFPTTVEPAVWWPQQQKRRSNQRAEKNGWSGKLEEEMKQIVELLKRKDIQEYVRLSKLALKVSRILSITGPLLTGLAVVGSTLVGMGSPLHGSWVVFLGVVAGVMESVVNTLEHGGQVGMVFEMYRSSAGFFRLMEEYIKSTLKEGKAGRRENGELFDRRCRRRRVICNKALLPPVFRRTKLSWRVPAGCRCRSPVLEKEKRTRVKGEERGVRGPAARTRLEVGGTPVSKRIACEGTDGVLRACGAFVGRESVGRRFELPR
uniref:Uncharacterized protein n=1 Tax=Nelumbo nucifera TaxID=4432 RepID=A0A822XI07_NELNU|nr:TPA_asm: hypothetical protein HUJ06_020142 [Nelumbo nucifera]